MKTVFVAGATGNLGGRIARNLLEWDVQVSTAVRPGSDAKKVAALQEAGVKTIVAELHETAVLTEALQGVDCVVSSLQGLKDVLVDGQRNLLEAAIAAGVPRFIPSDFSTDFTKLPAGQNRNFDIRREFHQLLHELPIAVTSIFNGAFAEILAYNKQLLDRKAHRIGYWEDQDWPLDFTTMDDTAAFTAAAALDPSTPRFLRIASFTVTPVELVAAASAVTGEAYALTRLGSLEELAAYNKLERAAHPEGEQELYPRWQGSQYVQSMFSTRLEPLDNGRYPVVSWTGVKEVLGWFR